MDGKRCTPSLSLLKDAVLRSGICKQCSHLDKSGIGVSFLHNADVMTSVLFETFKNSKLSFLVLASILAKYLNLRIHVHQCSITMVFSLFLRTAYMLLCVQTQL